MRYIVTVRHTCWVDMEIEAESMEEAEAVAEDKYISGDYDPDSEDGEVYCSAEEWPDD